jgi:uncharacterized damage-inducible protein DinB
MTQYEYFIETAEREFATTLKLIKAFPGDKLDFKPHERSNSARALFMTFLVECELMKKVTSDSMKEWSGMDAYNRDSLLEFADSFELMISEVLTAVRNLGEEKAQEMFTGFGSEQSKINGLWMMLFDQIHHRGQLSVYIRLAGGRVPQTYGPTADEPSLPNPQ